MDDVKTRLEHWRPDFEEIRRDIHHHPETAFAEVRTGALVAARLREWGVAVEEGIAGTGVVGTLRGRRPSTAEKAIGLRADMDALNVFELNQFSYKSSILGKMHACGHDGHTAMLLSAARYLAEKPDFSGTVHFIFQPAEEGEAGARAMIEDGLFKRFPLDAVFALHNMPHLDLGQFVTQTGPIMAGFDTFQLVIEGKGGHAAMPHLAVDPIAVGVQVVTALQSLVSAHCDAHHPVVLSVTRFHAGEAYNVIPDTCEITGSIRYLQTGERDVVRQRIQQIAGGLAQAAEAVARLIYTERYPPTVNSAAEASIAAEVIADRFGREALIEDAKPMMTSEDFAFMLNEVPGCYILAGSSSGKSDAMLHNPRYDFNDDLLVPGAQVLIGLVHSCLRH